jgi:hypothetical protein
MISARRHRRAARYTQQLQLILEQHLKEPNHVWTLKMVHDQKAKRRG